MCHMIYFLSISRMSPFVLERRNVKTLEWTSMACSKSWLVTKWCWSATMMNFHRRTNCVNVMNRNLWMCVMSIKIHSWQWTWKRRRVRLFHHLDLWKSLAEKHMFVGDAGLCAMISLMINDSLAIESVCCLPVQPTIHVTRLSQWE